MVEKPVRKRLISVSIVAALFALICCGVGATLAARLRGDNCSADTQSVIDGQAFMDFPPGAHDIDCGFIFFQGGEAWARFRIPSSELDTFLASTYVETVEDVPVPEDAHFHYNTLFVRDYLYGEGRFEEPGFIVQQFFLVDVHDPDTYDIYFEMWYGG
jgi:hypothetical protein